MTIFQSSTFAGVYEELLTELLTSPEYVTQPRDMKINEIKVQRLRETKDEIDELEAQKLELGLEQTRLVGIGAFRELDHFVEIWNQKS